MFTVPVVMADIFKALNLYCGSGGIYIQDKNASQWYVIVKEIITQKYGEQQSWQFNEPTDLKLRLQSCVKQHNVLHWRTEMGSSWHILDWSYHYTPSKFWLWASTKACNQLFYILYIKKHSSFTYYRWYFEKLLKCLFFFLQKNRSLNQVEWM